MRPILSAKAFLIILMLKAIEDYKTPYWKLVINDEYDTDNNENL